MSNNHPNFIDKPSATPELKFANAISKKQTLMLLYSIVILSLFLIKFQKGIDPSYLLRDPSATLEAPFYVGMISNIGILIWCASTSICFFTFAITRQHSTPMMSSFLLGSGAINCLLLCDDFFLLHEEVFPDYLYLSEKKVMVLYLMFGLWYAWKHKKNILKTHFLFLITAISFFVLSVGCDQATFYFPESWLEDGTQKLIEDGLKLLGIVTFAYYYIDLCSDYIHQVFGHQEEARIN